MNKFLLCTLSALLLASSARAQSVVFRDTITQFSVAQQPGSSLGRDFWFAPIEIPAATYYDLTIAAASNTTVFVQFPDSAFIAVPVKQGTPSRFSIPLAWILQTSDTIERKAIHVWCDSTDLCMDLFCFIGPWYCKAAMSIPPTSAWDTDYVIATGPVEDYGSEFTITASKDSTLVTVIPYGNITHYVYPRDKLSRPKGTPFAVVLNRGQSVQYQNYSNNDTSFSGTTVRSTEPVGIAAGATGANSFYPQAIRCASIPPRRSWGKTYYSAPNGSSSVLFVASVNNQVIERYDQFKGWQVFCSLAKANDVFSQDIIDSGARWVSNQPFLMANYQAPYPSGSAPIEFIPEPIEQFRSSVFFAAPALRGDSYSAFGVNMIVNAHARTATLDGQDILSLPAIPLDANHNLYRAGMQTKWVPSQHLVQSDSAVDVYVTGGSGSNSFGYGTGNGMLIKRNGDSIAPHIVFDQHVACLDATIDDSASGLAGFIGDTSINFKIAWDSTFKIGQSATSVTLCIIDSLKPASFSFTAYDIAGNGSRVSISYLPNPRILHPGITVLAVQPDTCLVGTSKLFMVTLTDTSLRAIKVTKITSDNAAFIVQRDTTITGRLPFELLPGQPHTIDLLFTPQAAQLYTGNLHFSSPDISTESVALQGLGYSLAAGVAQSEDAARQVIALAPNPAENIVSLATAQSGIIRFALLNALGESVYNQEFIATDGTQTHEFNLSHLPNGVYFYRVECGGASPTMRVTAGKFIISR